MLLEIGVPGGRTGCRTFDDALALARRSRASAALRLAGIECYEGLSAKGDSEIDRANADSLMQRVTEIALRCDREHLFETDDVIVSAGGSAIFDLVVPRAKPVLSRPVGGLLRSGCYVTHDHGLYRRMVAVANLRLACGQRPAGRARSLGTGAVAARAGARDPRGRPARPVVRLEVPIPIARGTRRPHVQARRRTGRSAG